MNLLASRRRFLTGLAASGVLLPLSSGGLVRMALAGEKEAPKLKVVFVIVPDGTGTDSYNCQLGDGDGLGIWHPTVTGGATDTSDFVLRPVSEELAAYRSQSLYVRGLVGATNHGGHGGPPDTLRDKNKQFSSIDVLLGEHMPGTFKRTVYAAPHADSDFVSYDGRNMRTGERDPILLYESVFGTDAQRRQTAPVHVLDPALADIREVSSALSGPQKAKLQSHLDAIEQVKSDSGTLPPVGACEPLTINEHPFMSAQYRNEVQHAHSQVVAASLSCGITRVATLQIANSTENININDVSATINPHDLAHHLSAGITEQVWTDSRRWYMGKVKEFMDELAKYADPDVPSDTLLKHTLVVVTSEMADGAPEHRIDMPLVLMGGASGLLQTGSGNGRYLNISSQSENPGSSWPSNPVIGSKFVGTQRIWATIGKAAGLTVPYGGNIDPVKGLFSNVT